MPDPTVSAGLVKALLDYSVSRGANALGLAESAHIGASDLLGQDNRIPLARYQALFAAAKAQCNAPALALQFCEATRFEQLSVVGLICQSAATMGEALEQLNRYGRLVAEVEGVAIGKRFELVAREDGLWLEDHRTHPTDFPELTEATWGRFVCEFARHHGNTPFVKAVHVPHAAPAHHAEYERILRVPVVFSSDRNALWIDASWLSVEVNQPHRYVFGVLSEHADRLLQRLEGAQTVKGKVTRRVILRLHKGEVRMAQIASEMGMSRQTLYRKLKAEQISFEALLDEARHHMALHYLGGKKVSVSETAYLVGFSDPSAFSRAFKRWTGNSPGSHKAT